MFGLGRRKPQAQTPAPSPGSTHRLFELTFFPTGELIHEGWTQVAAEGMAPQADGKVEGAFSVGSSACRIDATLREGDAVLSMWADDKIVTSSLLLSSPDPATGAPLAASYLRSTRSTDLVQALAKGGEPFTQAEGRTERPLLVTLLMPAPSAELTDALLAVQRRWVAAVLA